MSVLEVNFLLIRDLMQQLWPMVKLVLEKLILWKDLNTIFKMNKEV